MQVLFSKIPKQYCIGKVETFDINELAKNRLLSLLRAAGLCENDCSEECSKECSDNQLFRSEEALHVSERGYEVILMRDIDEIMIKIIILNGLGHGILTWIFSFVWTIMQ